MSERVVIVGLGACTPVGRDASASAEMDERAAALIATGGRA